jgi:hypothetical protein
MMKFPNHLTPNIAAHPFNKIANTIKKMNGEIRITRHPLNILLEGFGVLLSKYNEFKNNKIISNIIFSPFEDINLCNLSA